MSTNGRVTRRSLKSGSLNAARPVHKGGKSKGFTTRNLAALDFLRTIHMAKEPEIVENGMIVAKRAQNLYDLDANVEDGSDDEELEELQRRHQLLKNQIVGVDADASGNNNADGAVGRKLQGRAATTVRLPANVRHQMLRLTEAAAVVRNWEDQLLRSAIAQTPNIPGNSVAAATKEVRDSLLKSRMFCSAGFAYPTLIFSVMAYDAGKERAKQDRLREENSRGNEAFALPKRDWRGLSYKTLFKAISEDYIYESNYLHDPDMLDPPSLLLGERRHVAQRSPMTGPVLSSVVLYVNEEEYKEHVNELFREKNRQVPPSLTFSKICSVKKQVLIASLAMNIEVSSVAIATICFERLVIKGIITKSNRKLAMAACWIIAVKFNEVQLEADTYNIPDSSHPHSQQRLYPKNHIDAIFQFVDTNWSISKQELLDAEFGCFVSLGFSLHFPSSHILVVFTRLLKMINRSVHDYIDSDVMETHIMDMRMVEYAKSVAHQTRVMEQETIVLESRLLSTVNISSDRPIIAHASAGAEAMQINTEESVDSAAQLPSTALSPSASSKSSSPTISTKKGFFTAPNTKEFNKLFKRLTTK